MNSLSSRIEVTLAFKNFDIKAEPGRSNRSNPNKAWVEKLIQASDIFSTWEDNHSMEGKVDFADIYKSHAWRDQQSDIDYRLGRVYISGMDFSSRRQSSQEVTLPENDSENLVASQKLAKADFVGEGIIRLYKEFDNSNKGPSNDSHNYSKSGRVSQKGGDGEPQHSNIVAVLAVPRYMTPLDFLGFIGDETMRQMTHIRFLMTEALNRYMVLIKFRSCRAAGNFQQSFVGKRFNSIDSEDCQVLFIRSAYVGVHENFTDEPIGDSARNNKLSNSRRSGIESSCEISKKPLPPRMPYLRELPTCPVCLERMDSNVTGLLTVLCQHTFHCQCLSKWGDQSCPVCRFSLVKESHKEAEERFCHSCGATDNLWICMVCGSIGCGRYDQAHAYEHYMQTGHCYSMDMSSQRIWDYAGDEYVHRLLQNQLNGKLVELPSLQNRPSKEAEDMIPRTKLDNVCEEYSQLLASQLESQRMYYEEQITRAADKAARAQKDVEKRVKDCEDLNSKIQELETKLYNLSSQTVPSLEADNRQQKERNKILTDLSKRLRNDYNDEKTLNQSMLKKLDFYEKELAGKAGEIGDLKENLRDLMFHMDAQMKLQNADTDVKEGKTVVCGPSESGKKKPRRKDR